MRGWLRVGKRGEGYEWEKWGWLWGEKGTVIGRKVGEG